MDLTSVWEKGDFAIFFLATDDVCLFGTYIMFEFRLELDQVCVYGLVYIPTTHYAFVRYDSDLFETKCQFRIEILRNYMLTNCTVYDFILINLLNFSLEWLTREKERQICTANRFHEFTQPIFIRIKTRFYSVLPITMTWLKEVNPFLLSVLLCFYDVISRVSNKNQQSL